MRTITIVIVWASLVTCAGADPPDRTAADCFVRLANDLRIDDTLTVYRNDSTVFRGNHTIINLSASLLYFMQITDSPISGSLTIPFDRITRVTYRRPSHARWGLTVLGLGVGGVIGGLVGVALAPEEESGFLDFQDVYFGFFGAVIGGLLGAATGHEIGKGSTREISLECR